MIRLVYYLPMSLNISCNSEFPKKFLKKSFSEINKMSRAIVRKKKRVDILVRLKFQTGKFH